MTYDVDAQRSSNGLDHQLGNEFLDYFTTELA
jgi:hypothetical protein